MFVGNGGSRAYVAYVFRAKDVVILESILTGNATYVFGNDWREVLSLTKAEVIHEDLHKDRIIHVKGWEDKIHQLLQ